MEFKGCRRLLGGGLKGVRLVLRVRRGTEGYGVGMEQFR